MGKEYNLAKGNSGEAAAAEFLKRKGYKIVERNYRKRIGEIDIIASKKRWLVFVEVKTKSSSYLGHPMEMVNKRKQRKILKTALWYMAEKNIDPEKTNWRIDVIALMEFNFDLYEIEHIENAVVI